MTVDGEQALAGTSAEAAEVASSAAEGVREVAGEVRGEAKAVVGEARQQLDGFVAQARDEVGEQARQRNDQLATHLRTLSRQLTALADGRPADAGPLSSYVDAADQRVRRLAGRLERGGPEGVLE